MSGRITPVAVETSRMHTFVATPFRIQISQLLRLAAPMIGMTVSRMAMGFIDFVMVSQLGTQAQAAISPATVLVFSVVCIGMGAASSVQTFASQSDGRGEPEQGSAYAWQTFYIGFVLMLIVWPVTHLVAPFFNAVGEFAGHDPEVRRLEIEYTQVALWCAMPSVVCAGLNGFFNGIRRPSVSLIAVLVSLVFNIVANYALIFGNFGFPEMGIKGAAVATVLAWWVRAVVLLVAFCSAKIAARYGTRRSMGLSAEKLAGILRIGGPISLQWMLDILAWTFFMIVIIPRYGTAAMAASNACMQYMHLSFMPAVGVGMALCSQVGFSIGERKPDDAVARTRVAAFVTALYMGSVGILFYFGRHSLMDLMTPAGDSAIRQEVIEAGVVVLTWVAVFQVFDALAITYSNALQGAGDTRFTAFANALCCWGVFIGGAWLISRYWSHWFLNGPWMMCTLYISLLGCLLTWRFQSGVWRRIDLFGSNRTMEDPLLKPE